MSEVGEGVPSCQQNGCGVLLKLKERGEGRWGGYGSAQEIIMDRDTLDTLASRRGVRWFFCTLLKNAFVLWRYEAQDSRRIRENAERQEADEQRPPAPDRRHRLRNPPERGTSDPPQGTHYRRWLRIHRAQPRVPLLPPPAAGVKAF